MALKIDEELGNKKAIAALLGNIGTAYATQGKYPKALEYFFRELKIAEEVGNKQLQTSALGNIGLIYYCQADYPKALEHYFISLKIAQEIGDKNCQENAYSNLGSVYNDQKDYPNALDYYFRALKIAEEMGDKNGISTWLGNIGNVYKNQATLDQPSIKKRTELFSKALVYYFKALKIDEKLENKNGIARHTGNIGILYSLEGKFKEAEQYLKRAITINRSINALNDLKQSEEALSQLYDTTGQYKLALIHYKKAITLKDTIFSQANKKELVRKEMNYEFEKKEAATKAAQDRKDAFVEKENIRSKFMIYSLIGAVLFFFIIGVLVFLLFNRRLLKQKNKYQAEINKQQENAGLSILQAQEKEQGRIAKDLHDSIGTFLSTLKINLQLFEEYIPKEKFSAYQNAGKMIDQISVELRNIMKNLSSETLKEFGLVNAFEELVARINRLGKTQIDFHSHGLSNRLENAIEINLYRVGQELLNNCIKYSEASNATLQLIEHDNNVMLMIEDNGVGFDTQNPKANNKDHGMGLKNIRDRISFIKGKMQIDSILKRGTTFTIEIPKFLNLSLS